MFDSFLVGDGSAKLLTSYIEEESRGHQIFIPEEKAFVLVQDDLPKVDESSIIQLTTRDEVDWVFYTCKKTLYDLFGFLEIKSRGWMGAVKFEDLVMDDADKYLIDYLFGTIKDIEIWKQLATLSACQNMGISHVKFFSDHACPLCRASTGSILSVESLLRSLCTGGQVTHSGCGAELFPVLYREKYEGPLTELDIELITLGDRDILHAPVEFYRTGKLDELSEIHWPEVDFVNMPQWCKDNRVDASGVVVYEEDETLYVHNSYVGDMGPLDFISYYVGLSPVKEKLGEVELSVAETYWLNGKSVVKHGRNFYDAKTGERLG